MKTWISSTIGLVALVAVAGAPAHCMLYTCMFMISLYAVSSLLRSWTPASKAKEAFCEFTIT